MDIDTYLENTLSELGVMYHKFADKIESPVFVDIGGIKSWRYQNISESLACYLKGIKLISTLNASMVLLRTGYTQEIGALCRMANDFCNEIFYLLTPQDGENFRKDQLQFLTDFFQEEFDKPKDPLGSTQKRANVPVRKIHATFGKLASSELNQSDAQELSRSIHQAFSGYVHGAYPHIMEMFGGTHPRLSGMCGTPRVDEWRGQLIAYVYRTVMVSVFVARKLGLTEDENRVRELLEKFENDTGSKSARSAAELLKEMKKKRS